MRAINFLRITILAGLTITSGDPALAAAAILKCNLNNGEAVTYQVDTDESRVYEETADGGLIKQSKVTVSSDRIIFSKAELADEMGRWMMAHKTWNESQYKPQKILTQLVEWSSRINAKIPRMTYVINRGDLSIANQEGSVSGSCSLKKTAPNQF